MMEVVSKMTSAIWNWLWCSVALFTDLNRKGKRCLGSMSAEAIAVNYAIGNTRECMATHVVPQQPVKHHTTFDANGRAEHEVLADDDDEGWDVQGSSHNSTSEEVNMANEFHNFLEK